MDSKLNRAVLGLPILAFSVLMVYALILNQSVQSFSESLVQSRVFRARGHSVPLLADFYHLPVVDQIFSQIAPSFLYLQSFVDPIAYWQSLVFLVDYSAVYAILLFESSKPDSPAIIRYPSIVAMVAQVVPVGIAIPAVLYADFIFSKGPNANAGASAPKRFVYELSILPCILLCYFGTLIPNYFHPTLEGRHWWNWIWQLYPVWTALSLVMMTYVAQILGLDAFAQKHHKVNRLVAVAALLVASITTNAAVYLNSDLSQIDLFYPSYTLEGPTNGAIALRTILQYDQICCQGAAILWMSYQLWQLKSVPQLFILPSLCIATAVFSYGWCTAVLLLAGWTVKEYAIDTGSGKAKAA